MAKKLYVGNLCHSIDDEELKKVFEEHGTVVSARVIIDRESGRSKGFGFVEMSSDAEANTAIETLNGKEVSGRKVTVNEARPKEERPPRRTGGGFGGGAGGGGGGRGGFGGGERGRSSGFNSGGRRY